MCFYFVAFFVAITSILLYQNKRELFSLIELANQAKDKGKYLIHYGM